MTNPQNKRTIPNIADRAHTIIRSLRKNPTIPKIVYIDEALRIRSFRVDSDPEKLFKKTAARYDCVGTYKYPITASVLISDIEFVARDFVQTLRKSA